MNERHLSRHKQARRVDKAVTLILWLMMFGMLCIIGAILINLLMRGLPYISLHFLLAPPEELDAGGGIGPLLFNSLYVLVLSLMLSIPIGFGAGVYMAEYAKEGRLTNMLRSMIECLASVPSIVFGLFGMYLFVNVFHIGLTILGASASLALLNLPVLTRVTEESIRAVPQDLREASYAMGATKFQCIMGTVVPAAFDGIMTGIGLVAGRAFGESAVIILTGGMSTSGSMWDFNLFSPGETLAVHLWYVRSEAIVPDAAQIADKTAAVLIFVVLLINLGLRGLIRLKRIRNW